MNELSLYSLTHVFVCVCASEIFHGAVDVVAVVATAAVLVGVGPVRSVRSRS